VVVDFVDDRVVVVLVDVVGVLGDCVVQPAVAASAARNARREGIPDAS